MGFPRQEYQSGLPFLSPRNLPYLGIGPRSPAIQAESLPTEPPGKFLLDQSSLQFSSVQFSRSVVSDSLRPHESQHARPPCPSPTPGVHSDSSIESVMPCSHLILCRPLLLLPPIPPSIRVFSNESTLPMRWPKYWSFNCSIIPSKEIPGLISFRMDSLDLHAVQGILKSLLQHHSSKASIFGAQSSSQSNSHIHT